MEFYCTSKINYSFMKYFAYSPSSRTINFVPSNKGNVFIDVIVLIAWIRLQIESFSK